MIYIIGPRKCGICQRDNDPIKEQKTFKGHLWLFAMNKIPLEAIISWPLNKNACYLIKNERHTNSFAYN